MDEILKRFLTAMFCVVYSLTLMSWNIYTLTLYYISLTIPCLFEYHYKMDSTRKKITILLSSIIHLLILGYVLDIINIRYLGYILPICMSLFGIELFYGEKTPMLNIGTDLIGIVWICMPMILSVLLSFPYNNTLKIRVHDPRIMYIVMTLVLFNDTGAYFIGRFFGNYKLYSAISPKKTWEGAIGGALTSSLVCYIIHDYYDMFSNFDWIIVLTISVICGTIGDLIESMFKRDLRVKDTGNILPGHGGVLDRIDGILYAVPFVYSYLMVTGKFGA